MKRGIWKRRGDGVYDEDVLSGVYLVRCRDEVV